MKSLKLFALILPSIILLLNSCTVKKRVYLPGYYTVWSKSEKKQFENNNKLKDEANKTEIYKISENTTDTVSIENDNNISASIDNSFINLAKEKISFTKKDNERIIKSTKPSLQLINTATNKRLLKNKKIMHTSENDAIAIGIIIIGAALFLLGFISMFIISFLMGVVLIFLGLVFAIAGILLNRKKRNPSSKNNNKESSEYIDVVYLKSGSIVKGTIIEQTPNVSIKIQTQDGSIFVYKMTEVEKMTKEHSK